MAVARCERCEHNIDLDYNTNGHFFEDEKNDPYIYTCEYVCEHCLTDEEIEKLEEQNA